MTKYKHLVFDIDGTLVDNEHAVLHTWQETLEELLGKRYELEELGFVLGIPGVTSMERLGITEPEKATSAFTSIPRFFNFLSNFFFIFTASSLDAHKIIALP